MDDLVAMDRDVTIVQLRKAGRSYLEIAAQLGVSTALARHVCKRAIKRGEATPEDVRYRKQKRRRPGKPPYEGLYEKLVKRVRKDEQTGCWIWTGPYFKNRPHPGNRYGYFTVKEPDGRWRARGVHRLMMIAIHGPLTPQQCACHKCDVPLCINPDHLFVGTMKDNIWDSRRKGRHYESRRDRCERGHPLFGDNLRVTPGKKQKRTCKTCETGRYRLAAGWPEHLAFDRAFKVPAGYMLDRTTWQIVPGKGRFPPTVTAPHD